MTERAMPTIYRFYDEAGALLYVGQSVDPLSRFRAHRRSRDWWTEIAAIGVEHVAHNADLDAVERRAILDEGPRYNVAYNKHERRPEPTIAEQADEVFEMLARDACTETTPWVWMCDACGNHGTADSHEEARLMGVAHVAFREADAFIPTENVTFPDSLQSALRNTEEYLCSMAYIIIADNAAEAPVVWRSTAAVEIAIEHARAARVQAEQDMIAGKRVAAIIESAFGSQVTQ